MYLDENDLKKINELISKNISENLIPIIKSIIKEEIKITHNICKCGLTEEMQRKAGNFYTKLIEIGEGDLDKGITIFSRTIEFMQSIKRTGEKAGGKIAVYFLYLIVLFFTGLLATGIGVWIKSLVSTKFP